MQSEQTYVVKRDERNRLSCQVDETMNVAIQILSETDPRRMEKGIQGFAVITLQTPLGTLRIRNVQIMKSQNQSQEFYLRWYKHYVKGTKPSNPTSERGRNEWLDVVGPLDQTSRGNFERYVLGLFRFIKETEAKGTNRRPGPGSYEPRGSR